MKNVFKNCIAFGLIASMVLGSGIGASAAYSRKVFPAPTTVKNISKIVVSGNVELILVQDVIDYVKLKQTNFTNIPVVQEKNGFLHINSYNKDKLTVVVHLKNLSDIVVEDKSTVKTYGSLYLLDLHIVLRNQAKADFNANTISLSTSVSGDAKLNLTGTTENYDAKMSDTAGLNLEGFVAKNTSISSLQCNNVYGSLASTND